MLDELLTLIIAQLDLKQAEIDSWIEKVGDEVEIDNTGQTRRRQLLNVLRSSRPVDAQIDSFEKTYWDMEIEAAPKLKAAIVQLLALALQRRKIDVLKAKRLEQREKPDAPQQGEIHDDYVRFCLGLDALGAGPSKVAQFKIAEEAIIADLARWKSEDPCFRQAENPWIDVRAVYAGRTMEIREKGQRVRRMSTPGSPPGERPEPGSTKYWRFPKGTHSPTWTRALTANHSTIVAPPAPAPFEHSAPEAAEAASEEQVTAQASSDTATVASEPDQTLPLSTTEPNDLPVSLVPMPGHKLVNPWDMLKPVPPRFDKPTRQSEASPVRTPSAISASSAAHVAEPESRPTASIATSAEAPGTLPTPSYQVSPLAATAPHPATTLPAPPPPPPTPLPNSSPTQPPEQLPSAMAKISKVSSPSTIETHPEPGSPIAMAAARAARNSDGSPLTFATPEQAYRYLAKILGRSARVSLMELVGLSPDTEAESIINDAVIKAYNSNVHGQGLSDFHEEVHNGRSKLFIERFQIDVEKEEYRRLTNDPKYRDAWNSLAFHFIISQE